MSEQPRGQPDVEALARTWLDADPDDDSRAELQDLLAGPPADLAARFAGRLQFGTAGLRGELGAGPLRMNRVTVRQAAAGLVQYLLDHDPRTRERGIVVGYDARHKSDVFALDTARVAAARGVPAVLLSEPLPTPVLSFAVTELATVGGVMVTASHNPPRDNGYKVYTADGAQIVPPVDAGISACIEAVDVAAIAVAAEDDPLIQRAGRGIVEEYVRYAASVRLVPEVSDVVVAYTPLHGVGRDLVAEAFAHAGFAPPHVVDVQARPDPDFPTVGFPNPEEPGAMDALLAEAVRTGADVALANDPDADRLGVAVPGRDGGWRPLKGDEIGWILADHILGHTTGDDRLVLTTLVSSSLLGTMAAAHGVHHAETYTGFKWMGRYALDHPELRLVFGYEQALGYLVAGRPLDKDGVSAAVMMAEVAALAKAEGVSVLDRLDALAERFGRHLTAEQSLRMDPTDAAEAVARLRDEPPTELAGRAVTEVVEYPEANLVRLWCDTARVQVRPSGTEPKVKLYGEDVDQDPTPLLDALAELILAS